MRLWWVSMSLFMELEGELGVVIFSCCSSNGIPHWLMRLERSEELVVVSSSFTSSTSSNSWKRDMVDSLVRSISTSIQLLSMEAVFSMLFMELEGELGVVIFSCCSSNGIPHWLMRLERSE